MAATGAGINVPIVIRVFGVYPALGWLAAMGAIIAHTIHSDRLLGDLIEQDAELAANVAIIRALTLEVHPEYRNAD